MSTAISHPEVRSYLEAVRAHLSDIPERDLDELVEDLEGHLLEVAAEDDGSLEERLGPPAVYAEELRATAGLPNRGAGERERLSRRIVDSFERSALGHAVDAVATSKTARMLRTFLPQLRPGWWVLRGYLVVWAASVLTYESHYTNPFVPNLGSYAIGITAAVAAIVASVAVGRATTNRQRVRTLSWLANGAIVAASVAAVMNAGNLYEIQYVADGSFAAGLQHSDSDLIENICPYAADGTPLTGVLLFDETGRPIVDVAPPSAYNGYPVERVMPAIPNAYPMTLNVIDPLTGQMAPIPCPSLVARPTAAPIPGSGD